MFNKVFSLDIVGTSPFAWEESENPHVGIVITGWVHTDKMDFLSDLDFGEKVIPGSLATILSGELPIDGAVPLRFSKPENLEFQLGEFKPVSCSLEGVSVGALDDEGQLNAKLKIKLKEVKETFAGEVVSRLKSIVPVKLLKKQTDLEFKKGGKP